MRELKVVQTLKRSANKVGFQIKKHSPEILMVAGVAGVVTSTVMACKATTKLSTILEESKENIDLIHEAGENPEKLSQEYTKEDVQKDLAIVYVQTGFKIAKLYAPAVLVGTLSIVGMVKSNDILRKRNIALAAAYTTLDKGFKEYRGRVIDRFGKELDRELKYGIKAQEVTETVVNEDGSETTVTKTVETVANPLGSAFARFYDDGCTGWSKDPESNLMFLTMQQNYFNDILKIRGYLFLNEVYGALNIPKTKAGQVVGWKYEPGNPERDNYVDFGIFDIHKEANRNFVNGYERTILLDFNVDGPIVGEVYED